LVISVFSIVSNRRRIVEAKLQRERELRQELDELGVQTERKLLSIRRNRHQFLERYYYLCEKAELIAKRCDEPSVCGACATDHGAVPARGDRAADEPEVKTRSVVCAGSTNLPPLWLSCVKDVAATVDCLAGNADRANNNTTRKAGAYFMRKGETGITLPPVGNDVRRERYGTTVSNGEVMTNRFPPIPGNLGRRNALAGRIRGRFRPLVKVMVGLLKKDDVPKTRRRSHEKVLLTMDELSTCRYLRMPNDTSPWATYRPTPPR